CEQPIYRQRRRQKKRCPNSHRAAWRPSRPREDCGAAACRRDASPLLAPRAGHTATRRAHAGLVVMAPLASRACQILARQTACSVISTTVVLAPLALGHRPEDSLLPGGIVA